MSSSGVEIKFNLLPGLSASIPGKVSQAVRKAGLDVQANAQTSMAGGKSGKTYKRPGGKTHQASAPGETPAVDSGDLAGSFETEMDGQLTSVVRVTSDHAAVQELGGKKQAARPYLRPALEKVKPTLVDAIEKIVKNP